MDEVFGCKPSLSNLRDFFKNEAIQRLWNNRFADEAPTSSRVYKGVILEDEAIRNELLILSASDRKKLSKHSEKFSPAGFEVFP